MCQDYRNVPRTYSDVAQTLSYNPNFALQTDVYSMEQLFQGEIRVVHLRLLIDRSIRKRPAFPPVEPTRHTTCFFPRYDVCLPNLYLGSSRVPKCRSYRIRHADQRYGHPAGALCERGREDIPPIFSRMERGCELLLQEVLH